MDTPWFRPLPRSEPGSDLKRTTTMSLANFDQFQRTADRFGGLFLLALGLMVGGATALVGF